MPLAQSLHKIFASSAVHVNYLLGGPAGWLLILLSMGVFTILFERGRFWYLWWRRRHILQSHWQQVLDMGGSSPLAWIEERDQEMCFAQSFLECIIVVAPLTGLIGTVLGLSRILTSLGPQFVLPPNLPQRAFGDVLLITAIGLVVSLMATLIWQLNNGLRERQLTLWRRDLSQQPRLHLTR